MQIHIPPVNNQHHINKKAVDEIITKSATIRKDDENKGTYIKPYLPVNICDNLIYQNVYLSKCLNTFAEDLIYNDINLKNKLNETQNDADIIYFWEDNAEALCDTIKDYLSYGFGACEILFPINNNDAPVKLKEISADTLSIKKVPFYNEAGEKEYYYYASHRNNGDEVLLRLSHLVYPERDEDLPVCLWFGGGRKSDYFSYPAWLEAFNHVSASVSLDLLDAQKLSDGNLISGILVIRKPPAPITSDGNDIEDTLEEKMENKGSGVFTLELTTLNPNIPLEVDYIQISESNYDYLKELSDKSDMKILACFKMPKARLLIDDTTESMNSNKTNTLYKIYSTELNNNQRPVERKIRAFNNKYFDNNSRVDLVTPQFVDEKDIEIENTLKVFNNGLITLGQAIQKIQTIDPSFNTDEIEFNNPIYHERYYNGQPLGLTEPSSTEEINFRDLSEYIDSTVIEEKLK